MHIQKRINSLLTKRIQTSVLVLTLFSLCYMVYVHSEGLIQLRLEKPSEEFNDFLQLHELDETDLSKSENIFFIESSGSKIGSSDIGDLKKRDSCCIESAALMNPDSRIRVIFVSRLKLNISEFVKSLLNYENVAFHRINLKDVTKDTIAEEWINSEKIYNTSFIPNNISNFLRLFLLWKYGGTYLDLDVISLSSINTIGEDNFITVEEKSTLNNAIIRFDSMSTGHTLAETLLRDFMESYDGRRWGHNGPNLVTRVLKTFCEFPNVFPEEKFNCSGVTILPKKMCSEIFYKEVKQLFSEDPEVLENTLGRLEDSHLIHLYNLFSRGLKVKTNSKTAIIEIAKDQCPIVLSNSGDYFD
ncbi:CLUMA_CG017714, isoform A [Clunio marinus]|uniref:CLUMA_CG017714, isoform A n=1 Tax=Clunio marinus TaxID=568069 RepID=A0A1J1IY66_9DIPT|nr:CLUMA_CG017714, isoform A [Clunio marinus]